MPHLPDLWQALHDALGGDQVAGRRLGDSYAKLVSEAFAGSSEAAFILNRMLDFGLGRPADQVECWAWIRWAGCGCLPVADLQLEGMIGEAFIFFLNYLPDNVRSDGDRWLNEQLKERGVQGYCASALLQLEGDGSEICIVGHWSSDGWEFKLETGSNRFSAIEETAKPPPETLIASWRMALKKLDCYPWCQLTPVSVHPEFQDRVWQARQRRTTKAGDIGRIAAWVDACGRRESL